MEQFFGDSVRVTCPPRKSLKFINLLLMFLVATMRPSCTYSNTMVGTAATSSASSSAASAHKKVSGNQNTENIDKLVDDHLSSAEARALYEKANRSTTDLWRSSRTWSVPKPCIVKRQN